MTVLELNSGNENQQKGQDDLMSVVIKKKYVNLPGLPTKKPGKEALIS